MATGNEFSVGRHRIQLVSFKWEINYKIFNNKFKYDPIGVDGL